MIFNIIYKICDNLKWQVIITRNHRLSETETKCSALCSLFPRSMAHRSITRSSIEAPSYIKFKQRGILRADAGTSTSTSAIEGRAHMIGQPPHDTTSSLALNETECAELNPMLLVRSSLPLRARSQIFCDGSSTPTNWRQTVLYGESLPLHVKPTVRRCRAGPTCQPLCRNWPERQPTGKTQTPVGPDLKMGGPPASRPLCEVSARHGIFEF